jgi:serine/threonine protein kinase
MSESEEYERTWVVRQPASPSPSPQPAVAGAAGEADANSNALPLGTRIGEFEIVNLVGIGGFGIVYLAHDHSLGRYVALKEYMPSSLAARVEGLTVAVKSARLAETFAIGLRSFVNEARILAQFDHRSLVKVYRFWEGNGTAYMVMPFYEGVTLRQTLQKMPGPPSEEWLRA